MGALDAAAALGRWWRQTDPLNATHASAAAGWSHHDMSVAGAEGPGKVQAELLNCLYLRFRELTVLAILFSQLSSKSADQWKTEIRAGTVDPAGEHLRWWKWFCGS